MNISVDAIIISLTARCLKAFTPADFPSTISIRFYKLLKNNMPTCDGKPKWPVRILTAAWVCTERVDNQTAPATRRRLWKYWWRMSGSNRRPPACKAGALPAELIPHDRRVVGLVGFEPTTPALSRRCSNQLSYRPTSISSRAA